MVITTNAQSSARLGRTWRQPDADYMVICVLEGMGLVSDVRGSRYSPHGDLHWDVVHRQEDVNAIGERYYLYGCMPGFTNEAHFPSLVRSQRQVGENGDFSRIHSETLPDVFSCASDLNLAWCGGPGAGQIARTAC
jgi:hypothetical protein